MQTQTVELSFSHRWSKVKRWFLQIALLSLFAIVSGELFSRYYLGLGAPSLYVAHPTIEYMLKPNQDFYRFGNHVVVNQYGMRSHKFDRNKGANEYRVLVFGDSVINGGNLTDHKDLATTILADQLCKTLNKPVIVGNVSAGSWGPGNWFAYANEFGLFDADVVVLVISSHDYADNPKFLPLNENTHPTQKPFSALVEGIQRYVPRYFPRMFQKPIFNQAESDRFMETTNEREVSKALDDLRAFLLLAENRTEQRTLVVFQHCERDEVEQNRVLPGHQRIRETCDALGIPTEDIGKAFRQSMEKGKNPYRDNIHPNETGQKIIAQRITEYLNTTLHLSDKRE